MKRRDIFKAGLAVLASSVLKNKLFAAEILMDKNNSEIPKRKYNDDVDLSIVGFGGIIVVGMDQNSANNTVAKSIDNGINYFDVAPSYWDGEAETKLGKALQPYRKNIFLACKTMERSAKGAKKELEISLNRIGVDHFDLYQFHAVTTMNEVEEIFAPDGAAETFIKAHKDGKIKHIGFSAHSEQAAMALMDRFDFDSVLFPVNFVNYANSKFGPTVVERARKMNAAVLALKALAYTPLPDDEENIEKSCDKCWYQPVEDPDLAEKALRFTLSQDITAAIPPGDERWYNMALKFARRFEPMDFDEQEKLLTATMGVKPLFPL
jgi:predicted aldo/keto reductase-like oxidoreductase